MVPSRTLHRMQPRRWCPVPNAVDSPHRINFASYKLRILQEADLYTESGQMGAFLRRESLNYSNLQTWHRQLDLGQLAGLTPKKRGRKEDPIAKENARLKREVDKLKAKLEKAETIIDVQKKLSKLLGLSLSEDVLK